MVAAADLDRALWSLRAYDTLALATVGENGPHVAAFFFAPERSDDGIRLLIATPPDSRKLREVRADPRVAFMCHPGDGTRWITGWGMARPLDGSGATGPVARLLAHAPGARTFVEASPIVVVEVAVARLEVVDAVDTAAKVLDLER
jgi:Pyridoxamine 5'-phosphate oxidase